MEKIATLFKVPELRQKILITLMFLVIFRVGTWIPLPIVDQESMVRWAKGLQGSAQGKLFGYVAMFAGINDMSNSTIFGLGIMPYISASIIFQLLAAVVPTLEKLMKEGESGRKKINEYTRYATVVLTFFQSIFWVNYLMSPGGANSVPDELRWSDPVNGIHLMPGIVSVFIMTAGTIFLMWIGEQIDEFGIGNGISLIIMSGICSRLPMAIYKFFRDFSPELAAGGGKYGLDKALILAFFFVAVIVGVIAITQSQRRIPTQSAKHVRGRRVFGGTRHYLPLKVNQAGVMPIIFASSLLMFPGILLGALRRVPLMSEWWWLEALHTSFNRFGYVYNVCYVLMIYFFCYFWTAITFNPKDMATNLKDYGSFIPGYRPGRRTAEYLEKVMLRITYVGSAFLALVAILPTLVTEALAVDPTIASFFGGTGLLIVVSVALDLVQKIDSHLVMRNYAGLLEKG